MKKGHKEEDSSIKKRKKGNPEKEEPVEEEIGAVEDVEPKLGRCVYVIFALVLLGLLIILGRDRKNNNVLHFIINNYHSVAVVAVQYLPGPILPRKHPQPNEPQPGAPKPQHKKHVDPEPIQPAKPIEERISLFVIGKSATGKSTLAHGLLGLSSEEIDKRGQAFSSAGVSVEEIDARGVTAKMFTWKSPELKQPELEDSIITQIRKVDFVLLTLRMDDTRIRPEDKTILRKLGHIFGTQMWEKTVVTLTYANRVDYIDRESIEEKKSKSHLEKRKAEWMKATHTILVQEKIPHDLMCSIPILPAGYYKKPELYDESWRDVLISGIMSRVTKNARKTVKKALGLEEEVKIPQNFCPKVE